MNEVSEVFAGGEVQWSTQGPLPVLQRQQQRIPCPQAVSPDPVVDWTGVQVAWGDGRLFCPFSPNPV